MRNFGKIMDSKIIFLGQSGAGRHFLVGEVAPRAAAQRAHGRVIVSHDPFLKGGVLSRLRRRFFTEVSGSCFAASVFDIWAMRDDGPPARARKSAV